MSQGQNPQYSPFANSPSLSEASTSSRTSPSAGGGYGSASSSPGGGLPLRSGNDPQRWPQEMSHPQSHSGGGSSGRACLPQNVSFNERLLSATLGGGLVTYGLKNLSLRGLVMAGVGFALVHRGVTGFCQAYHALGQNSNTALGARGTWKQMARTIGTRAQELAEDISERRWPGSLAGEHEHSQGSHSQGSRGVAAQAGARVEKSLIINRPPSELFRFWRNFENLPRVFGHLESVCNEGANRSCWKAQGPMGMKLEWQAEIINEREGELISWESTGEGDVDTAGSVRFAPGPDRESSTVVTVTLKYDPPGGKAAIQTAAFFKQDLESILEEDLQRFKKLMESGEAALSQKPAGA